MGGERQQARRLARHGVVHLPGRRQDIGHRRSGQFPDLVIRDAQPLKELVGHRA
jgi:hypothetical protein